MLKDFLAWLDENLDPNEGDEARVLKELLANRRGALWQAADLEEARKIVERYAQDKRAPAVLQIFGAAVEEWQRTAPSPQPAPEPSPAAPPPSPKPAAPEPSSATTQPSPDKRPGKLATILSNLPIAAVIGIAALLVWIIAKALLDKELLRMLGDIAIARGLITFLFAVGTIGIAVLMVSALFVGSESGLKERFDHGNQILTALIAILGTVVGFYFGSSSTGTQSEQIEIGAPVLFPDPASAGSDVQLSAFAWGGAVPFTYNIDLRSTDETLDKALTDIAGGKSENGVIVEKFAIPPDAGGATILMDLE